MPILTFMVIVIAIGVLLWAVTTYVPMDARVKKLLVIVVVVALVLWVLQLFGVFDALSGFTIGKHRR